MKMPKEKENQEAAGCPVARFFTEMEKTYGKKSTFFDHLHQSQIEFLKAVRSLVDDRIGELERKKGGIRKKATKIEVM
jgi:hypothetical protein